MVLASYDSLFIGGEWVRPSSSARIEVTSASTEENIGSVPEAAEADVDAAVAAARRAFDDPGGWSQWEPSARAAAIEAAQIPAGVINIVPGGRELGAYLVEHRDVDKVAFTGSTAAGRRVAEACGRLLRPVTLELGGKSAAIVLEDADLDLAKIGNDLFAATLVNNGQTCYLGTRVLAPRSRYNEVVDTMAALAASMAVGDAMDPATQIGPMASRTHRDRVEGYIAKGASDGARVVTGGKDVARRVRTGTIGVNKYLPDPAAPFGGVKASGIGRELGPEAIGAYQQFKSIYT